MLPACTAYYQGVGHYENRHEVLVANLVHNTWTGDAQIEATATISGMICKGSSRVTYVPPNSKGLLCTGQKGEGMLECDDGRDVNLNWEAEDCTTGFGSGQDSEGNTIRFVFGLNQEQADKLADRYYYELKNKAPLMPYGRPTISIAR